ncbi:MAG: translation initiation factor [Myxococcaceae bacterium]|nr:translation initiation factor [Myxococcaceae bacterium]
MPTGPPPELKHSPFAALKGVEAAPRQAPTAAQPTPTPAQKKGPPKAVVRMERAGRNGKEVTVIEQLELSSTEREKWLKALKSALGCGGSIEDGGVLIVQGDHRERVAAWLEQRGVRQISVG